MVESLLAPGRLSEGQRIYAIGDVHGCLDRLETLHRAIAADILGQPKVETVLIHVGDYVDRGPDSAGVVGLLAGAIAPPVSRRVDLQGNHEAMMLAALSGDRALADAWLDNGGDATLGSYGLSADDGPERWAAAIPEADRRWIGTRQITHREGGYLFVHAGIRPGRKIHLQSPDDLLWIREPFLSSTLSHPFVIVHGHTVVDAPVIRANRIGIDTGAVMGGALTCLVLENDQMRFLSA